MKNLKNENGITLVALVVTIIVLLILAAVSISMVTGGEGIITKASNAVDTTELEAAKEQVYLEIMAQLEEYYENRYVNGDSTYTDFRAYLVAQTTGADSATKLNAGDYEFEVVSGSSDNLNVYSGSDLKYTGTISEKGKITNFEATSETETETGE